MAALYAASGHKVIGVDSNGDLVERLQAGTFRTDEPEVNDLLKAHRDRLAFERLPYEALLKSEIVFVVVPTPSKADGTFTSEFVVTACQQIGTALHDKRTEGSHDGYTLVVVVSTLMPGQMDADVLPALERTSGKRAGVDFGVCYSPEFIALGRVIEGLRHPDYILIGHREVREAQVLKAFYATITPELCRLMDYVNAELAKLATNAYLSLKIAYANVLGQICEQLPGANVDVVTQAVGSDHRIGGAYLRAGLPAGGVCLPRDLTALTRLDPSGALASVEDWNRNYVDIDLLLAITNRLRARAKVGILGIGYSPTSSIVEGSYAKRLASRLDVDGYQVAVSVLDGDAQAIVDESDAVILALPLDSFKALSWHSGMSIFDIWRVLNPATLPAEVSLWQFGVGAKVGEHV